MVKMLEKKFDWATTDYLLFKRSNDHSNINYVIRRMKHSQALYEDLAFLVPKGWTEGNPISPKFMVFFDNKKEAEGAVKYLMSCVSQDLRNKVPWFHAGMTKFFRRKEVENLKTGGVWGFAATDSGEMVRVH